MGSEATVERTTVQAGIGKRQRQLASTLQSLLEAAHLPPDSPEVAKLVATAGRWGSTEAPTSELADLASEVDAVTDAVSHWLMPQPLMGARRVNVALERIQSAKTLTEVMRTAPSELCWAGDFDRVIFSRIEDSQWSPVAWHTVQPDRPQDLAMAEFMRDAKITLCNGMIEAEIVRRRLPALVRDTAAEPRTFAPFLEIGGSAAYIVAPVVTGDSVMGLIHADSSDRPIADSDVATVRAFADGLGLVFERLALLDRLQSQKASLSAALAAAEKAVEELCTAPVTISRASSAPDAVEASSRSEDRIEDGLTAREREVFALLISGATNAQIADRLTVSETTVKSHVKHILRKMRASNRAQAIAQYLRSNGRGSNR
jgi:DNA-binding CsgD family transcriptional regulator